MPRTLRSSRASACGWGRAFQCADLRGTVVAQGQWPQREGQRCVWPRAPSLALCGCTTRALANATCGERSARHQRCATEGRLEGAVPPSHMARGAARVAMRRRCAAPHVVCCSAPPHRLFCAPRMASTLEVLVVARSKVKTMRFCGETYHLISADDLVGNHGARRTRLWSNHMSSLFHLRVFTH